MTNAKDPVTELVPLAWSWIAAPKLRMEGLEPDYMKYTYDPAQRAYVVPRQGRGPASLKFELQTEDEDSDAPGWIINPAFIVNDWDVPGVILKVNGKIIEQGDDFRVGYEQTPTGKDLVIWLKMKANENTTFSIAPN
jgi:hypothetical protein